MGQAASCHGNGRVWEQVCDAIRDGDSCFVVDLSVTMPRFVNRTLLRKKLPALHVAASNDQPDVLTSLVEKGEDVNASAYTGQTPLMLACKYGRPKCVEKLLASGANVLLFDCPHSRTCLHYAAKGGHIECIAQILDAAQSGPVAASWGFNRFINMRDCKGITALHLAARGGHLAVLQSLLNNGALVSASTTSSSNGPGHGSTPLHYAARGGSPEAIEELLAWGADRHQRDSSGYTAYSIARKYKHTLCAALLNPNSAEPLVWPSPCKFMNDLDPEAKGLLEAALAQANKSRQKRPKGVPELRDESGSSSDDQNFDGSEREICCICFEQPCTIEVQSCGHQMCATCILTICCHSKPNPAVPYSPPPACPFCRRSIGLLTLIQQAPNKESVE